MPEITCDICMHACMLAEGRTGRCRARRNVGGRNVCDNYGRLTSLAMDPIEKKPLRCFYPGSMILSVGSYGCNLSCPFCQNSSISMADQDQVQWTYVPAEELAGLIERQPDNLGIAFTYNEPLISWEYLADVARIVKPKGFKVVAVTNGSVSHHVLEQILPWVDAMNIDLKGGTEFYRKIGGSRSLVEETISAAAKRCHVEVTKLIIPQENDSLQEMAADAAWLASIDPEMPLHISRYFPRYRYHKPATDVSRIYELQAAAERSLKNVFTGNV
jgi:pyruvate formate lyase activating enzyme